MPRRPPSLRFWSAVALAILLPIAWTLFAASFDMLEATRHSSTAHGFRITPRLEYLLWDRGVEAFFGVWFFALGASVGSFLNVVAYRMPIGISLAKSGSRCPRCRTAIRARDNVPVFGWLALDGRCRACELPISPRYPIVETLTGLAFFAFYLGRLVNGNVGPVDNTWPLINVTHVLLDGRWDVVGLFVLHVVGYSLVWASALMLYDGNSPPLRFWLTGIISLLGLVFGLPWLERLLVPELIAGMLIDVHPWPVWADRVSLNPILHSLVTIGLGLLAGALAGSILFAFSRLLPAEPERTIPQQTAPTLAALPIPSESHFALELAAGALDFTDSQAQAEPLTTRDSNSALTSSGEESSTTEEKSTESEERFAEPSAFAEPRAFESVNQADESITEQELPPLALEVSGAETTTNLEQAASLQEPLEESSAAPLSDSQQPFEGSSPDPVVRVLDEYEPIVVPQSGSRWEPWVMLPALIGLTWGWQTLLVVVALSLPLSLFTLPMIRDRASLLRWWGASLSAALVITAPQWNWWIGWLTP